MSLTAPFPYFGGKRRAAPTIWRALGDPSGYVEPFAGIGTVPLRALKLGRRGAGAELNAGYFLDSVKYLEAQEREHDMPSLFDLEAS